MIAGTNMASLCDAIAASNDVAGLSQSCTQVARFIGFEHFAVLQRSLSEDRTAGLAMSDYPDDLMCQSLRNMNYLNSPIIILAAKQALPFAWTQIPRLMKLDSAQRRYLKDVARLGYREGLTIPVHGPNQAAAMVSFVTRQNPAVTHEIIAHASYMARLILARAHALLKSSQAPAAASDAAEMAIMREVFRGRAVGQIARKVGMSNESVVAIIQKRKQEFVAGSHMEIIVRALYAPAVDEPAICKQAVGDETPDARRSPETGAAVIDHAA